MFSSFFKRSPALELTKGTQIAYIPDHADGDINHKDVRFGFVASHDPRTGNVYCRFWSEVEPDDLKTKANSQFCDFRNVFLYDSKPQALVLQMIRKYDI